MKAEKWPESCRRNGLRLGSGAYAEQYLHAENTLPDGMLAFV